MKISKSIWIISGVIFIIVMLLSIGAICVCRYVFGGGNVITIEKDFPQNFNKRYQFELNSGSSKGAVIRFHQSDKNYLKITADEKFIDKIVVDTVEDKTFSSKDFLNVGWHTGYDGFLGIQNRFKKLEIDVYSTELNNLQSLCVEGTYTSVEINEEIKTENFVLSVGRQAKFNNLNIIAENLEISMYETAVQPLIIFGNSKNLNFNGGAQFNGENFKAENVKINAFNESTIKVWAETSLDVYATHNAKVYYKGSPTITKEIKEKAILEKLI